MGICSADDAVCLIKQTLDCSLGLASYGQDMGTPHEPQVDEQLCPRVGSLVPVPSREQEGEQWTTDIEGTGISTRPNTEVKRAIPTWAGWDCCVPFPQGVSQPGNYNVL